MFSEICRDKRYKLKLAFLSCWNISMFTIWEGFHPVLKEILLLIWVQWLNYSPKSGTSSCFIRWMNINFFGFLFRNLSQLVHDSWRWPLNSNITFVMKEIKNTQLNGMIGLKPFWEAQWWKETFSEEMNNYWKILNKDHFNKYQQFCGIMMNTLTTLIFSLNVKLIETDVAFERNIRWRRGRNIVDIEFHD